MDMRDQTPTLNLVSPQPGTIPDALQWLERMGERGIIKHTSVRLRRNAIEQLVSVLAADEPQTVEYVEAHLDAISSRWATLANANPDTARTYESRARTSFRDYTSYRQDPLSFKPRPAPSKSAGKKPTSTKSTQIEAPKQPSELPPPPPSAPALRNFPLGKDRGHFVFTVPEGMTMADVMKITYHLATLAEDFDPLKVNEFSMARRE
jgi:hypothetical protein